MESPKVFRTLAKSSLKVILALALPVLTIGCGGASGPVMGKVSGKVTYQGKPLTQGTVSFVSNDPNGANANSVIGPDGSYSLQTTNPSDGAVVGEYRVIVSDIDPNSVNTPAPGEPVKKAQRIIPEKYEKPETSGLTRKVEKGSNTIDIALE
jgi:hypothetical protein